MGAKKLSSLKDKTQLSHVVRVGEAQGLLALIKIIDRDFERRPSLKRTLRLAKGPWFMVP
jgi:hypothetical protein